MTKVLVFTAASLLFLAPLTAAQDDGPKEPLHTVEPNEPVSELVGIDVETSTTTNVDGTNKIETHSTPVGTVGDSTVSVGVTTDSNYENQGGAQANDPATETKTSVGVSIDF